jgi:hypothetical protein
MNWQHFVYFPNSWMNRQHFIYFPNSWMNWQHFVYFPYSWMNRQHFLYFQYVQNLWCHQFTTEHLQNLWCHQFPTEHLMAPVLSPVPDQRPFSTQGNTIPFSTCTDQRPFSISPRARQHSNRMKENEWTAPQIIHQEVKTIGSCKLTSSLTRTKTRSLKN